MPIDRFLIAPLNSGLMTNAKSWQIMDDAFAYLQNAYIFRGRLRKRFGTQLMGVTPNVSRLRILLGTTNGVTGSFPATNLPTGATQIAVGQIFSAGTTTFTVSVLGNVNTLSTDLTITGHINSTVNPNTFAITGNSSTNLGVPVYWYPSLPVMGITQYEIGDVNNHPTFAFDPKFAYVFSSGWLRSGTATWNGTDINYFWTTNWQSITGTPYLFVSNFNATTGAAKPAATDDPIWFATGTSSTALTWTAALGSSVNGFFFLPGGGAPHAGPFVQTARIILPFKNRLVLLNTIENDNSTGGGVGVATQYKQRCRFSINGSPFAQNAWYEVNEQDNSGTLAGIAAGAGYIDATTEEEIISAEFIKDRCIVYFERSTWELVYTQNENLPFFWQKLNTELGSQATFSTVPFDRDVLTIGNTGVHACNGSNVRRIDEKIPDNIFEFRTKNNATQRICGIRDYYSELVYWAYVDDFGDVTQKFPNQIMVYNYANNSWAFNDDCFTTFGYFEQNSDITWAGTAPETWASFNGSWISNLLQAEQRQILGGTPEGFVLVINDEMTRNAPSMYISAITFNGTDVLTLKIYNHNLSAKESVLPFDMDFIWIENFVGTTLATAKLNNKIFQVLSIVDKDTITIGTPEPALPNTEVYYGGATAARVSNIQLTSKNFNPYADKDMNVYVSKADFAVEKTDDGEITVDYRVSYSNESMLQDAAGTTALMGTGVLETSPYSPTLYPLEKTQELLWHPIYFQCTGEFIQLVLYLNQLQMLNTSIAQSAFEIQGICLYTQPSGRMQ